MDRLTNEDLRHMEEGMSRLDCTLTPYWASRVRLLIYEVKELRIQIEQHALANDGCVPKPAHDEIAAANVELNKYVNALLEGGRVTR